MIHDAALAEEFTIPDGLGIETALLVIRFASALSVKLRAAEIKHDHAVGWADEGWEEECRRQLEVHVEKGDPRDVAIYYAFTVASPLGHVQEKGHGWEYLLSIAVYAARLRETPTPI
jgi:hypothetical protein